jgi:hypothetical protein
MFECFTLDHADVGEARLRARHGGDGPPVVLLHGDRFAVVGHDRGALVAFRPAMDHPHIVEQLVIMDGLPVIEHVELNETFVRTWWHWWFLGQTDKPAERVINADPDAWYQTPSPSEMGEENHADVWAALPNPEVVHGMCEDYRAGLRIDRAHEQADRAAGRRIACPTLLLAATEDDIDIHSDPVAIWRPWVAGDLRGDSITRDTTRPSKRPTRSHGRSSGSFAIRPSPATRRRRSERCAASRRAAGRGRHLSCTTDGSPGRSDLAHPCGRVPEWDRSRERVSALRSALTHPELAAARASVNGCRSKMIVMWVILPLSTLWHSAPGAFRTGTVSVSYMTRRVKHPHTERPATGRHDVGQVAEVLGRRPVRDLDRPELSLELRADTRPALRAPTRSRCLPEVPLISLATHLRRLAPYVHLTLTHPAAPAGDVERDDDPIADIEPLHAGPDFGDITHSLAAEMSPRFR